MRTRLLPALLLSSFAALAALPAAADDDDRYRRYAKADLDDLDAEIRFDGRDWVVDVEYKVKIEGRRRLPEPALVLTVEERGRLVTLPDGQPVEIVVPLDHPTDVDDDELEFEQGMRFVIPDGAFARPWDLRLTGMVYAGPEGPVLDRDDTRIEEWRPDVGRNIHIGVSFGRSYAPIVHRRVVHRVYYPGPRGYEVHRRVIRHRR